ncbi:heavy metal translocating P-type ATPase [Jannaschia marina]|uniref:heavy metal translocating P-type ATPase n=1 Tax=Jannaschia marina TaxID=2741674 RepID=UPI0015C97274|nr:heavy metal translocating P-type ATPase [Jannaschia marina]
MTAACPACAVAPVGDGPAPDAEGEVLHLSLPDIHCASCIRGVERTLAALPGVRAARVNLGRRRVRVVTAPELDPGDVCDALSGAGYTALELDEAALAPSGDPAARLLLARIAVAGFAMMNVMGLSIAVWAGAEEATRALFHWIAAAIALPALAFSAVPFFASARDALRAGRLNMDVPIALAIALAGATSLYETITHEGTHAWFEAALSLTFFLLAGRYLDLRARAAARSAAAELTALEVPRATRIEGTARRVVAIADVRAGDRLALAPADRAPVDGTAESAALIDRSAVTGEADPVAVDAGGAICAGEIVLGSPLTLRATARAEDSTLRRLARLVEIAETGRHRHQGIADRAARMYAPLVHLLAGLAFAGWWFGTGSVGTGIAVATAVLIITCPCALGLAVPTVTASMTGRLFRGGILLKSDTALERLAEIDTVVFDKTGTLTEGRMQVALDGAAAGVARALAQASGHPVARAVDAALAGHVPAPLTDLREVTGEGVHGLWDGAPVFLGRGSAGTELHLPDRVVPLPLEEVLRPGAEEVVADLRAQGLDIHMLTGDTAARGGALAGRLGITEVASAVSPEGKARAIAALADGGRRVLMVGDGINDAAALAAAHASLAPASALDAARVAADGVLLGGDLRAIARTTRTARGALARIRQNLWIASLYNAIAIPIALAGLATPLAAAIAMSTSSVTVVLNAVRR